MAGNEGAYGFYYCIFTLSRSLASTLFTSYRTSSYLPPLRTLAACYTSTLSDPLAACSEVWRAYIRLDLRLPCQRIIGR